MCGGQRSLLSFRAKLARNGPSGLKAQQLAACGLRLAACGLRLAACGLRLAACGLRLAACGLRLAACGLRLAACGLRNTTHDGPATRRHDGLVLIFHNFFSSAVNPSSCTDIHSNIILFDPFSRCMLLSERRCHSMFIHLFTDPDREDVCFSGNSLTDISNKH